MNVRQSRIWIALALATVAATAVLAVVPPAFDMTRSTIDGGGVMVSSGGGFELSGTIGQPDARVLEGGGFTLAGGFWFEEPPCDCNADGGVDLLDHSDFEACFKGPDAAVTEGCGCFDVNRSGTIDLLDFAVGQTTFTGS